MSSQILKSNHKKGLAYTQYYLYVNIPTESTVQKSKLYLCVKI
jgi:hypothetical protein